MKKFLSFTTFLFCSLIFAQTQYVKISKSLNFEFNENNVILNQPSDYDIYLRTIYKLKIKGDATNKNELIGIVKSGGFSSQYSFMKHLIEEAKIRVNNNQNIFFVSLIFFNALIKKIVKEFF